MSKKRTRKQVPPATARAAITKLFSISKAQGSLTATDIVKESPKVELLPTSKISAPLKRTQGTDESTSRKDEPEYTGSELFYRASMDIKDCKIEHERESSKIRASITKHTIGIALSMLAIFITFIFFHFQQIANIKNELSTIIDKSIAQISSSFDYRIESINQNIKKIEDLDKRTEKEKSK
jgi:Fe2+ transport system protein B